MTNPTKSKVTAEAINNAEMEGSTIFLRRINWGLDSHPKLHALLQMLYEAEEQEKPNSPTPMIEIQFQYARYYLLTEGAADFAIRLYSDFRNRHPPFTQEVLDAINHQFAIAPENISDVEQILFGGLDADEQPTAE